MGITQEKEKGYEELLKMKKALKRWQIMRLILL